MLLAALETDVLTVAVRPSAACLRVVFATDLVFVTCVRNVPGGTWLLERLTTVGVRRALGGVQVAKGKVGGFPFGKRFPVVSGSRAGEAISHAVERISNDCSGLENLCLCTDKVDEAHDG